MKDEDLTRITDMSKANIRLVKQEDRFGCAAACLAMVTGRTYADVANDFPTEFLKSDDKRGVSWWDVYDWLGDNGYAVSMRYRVKIGNVPRNPWPGEPWADAHIVMIQVVDGSHFVVWLRDGTVLDPARDKPTTLSDPCYVFVNQIAGVHRL